MGSLRRSPLSRLSFACVTRVPFAYLPYTKKEGFEPVHEPVRSFGASNSTAPRPPSPSFLRPVEFGKPGILETSPQQFTSPMGCAPALLPICKLRAEGSNGGPNLLRPWKAGRVSSGRVFRSDVSIAPWDSDLRIGSGGPPWDVSIQGPVPKHFAPSSYSSSRESQSSRMPQVREEPVSSIHTRRAEQLMRPACEAGLMPFTEATELHMRPVQVVAPPLSFS